MRKRLRKGLKGGGGGGEEDSATVGKGPLSWTQRANYDRTDIPFAFKRPGQIGG